MSDLKTKNKACLPFNLPRLRSFADSSVDVCSILDLSFISPSTFPPCDVHGRSHMIVIVPSMPSGTRRSNSLASLLSCVVSRQQKIDRVIQVDSFVCRLKNYISPSGCTLLPFPMAPLRCVPAADGRFRALCPVASPSDTIPVPRFRLWVDIPQSVRLVSRLRIRCRLSRILWR